MARRMRDHDWGREPGPVETWPESLRAACRICLTSRFPMVLWWGPDLRFFYNDAYLPLLGTKHPALGKPGAEVWPDIWHIIGPMLDSVLATGQATWSEDLLLPMNRHGYLEESYWTYSYSPLHDDDGRVRGVFTAVSDTTERVIGERRLAALRDLGAQAGTARSAEEACQLVAQALTRAGRDVPYAEIHLRRPETGQLTLAAASPPGAVPPPSPDGPGGWPLAEALSGGRPVVLDDVAARFGALPAGGWQTPPKQAMVFPLPGETGAEPVGAIVLTASAGRRLDDSYRTFLDLVARQTADLVNGAVAYQLQRRRVEELAELDRAKTVFFSNISHEFRTPLTLIMGPVQELLDEPAAADRDVREELGLIRRNAMRLGKLVNTLLDFSRIEAGRMQARFQPVDLAEFTAELASVFRAAIEKAGLDFDVDCPPLPEPVYVDREMWEKAVLNLLSNALKFTFHGSVRVRLRAEDGQAVLRVSDTGIGIAAEEMPRLFERFHRVSSVRARSHEGSGIGLALVRELMGLHGGTITARSRPGEGTTFTVRLPFGSAHLPQDSLAPSEADGFSGAVEPFVQEALRWLPDEPDAPSPGLAPPPAPLPSQLGTPAPRPRVLIADDNADMREYLRRLLRAGCEVEAVSDGESALAAVRARPPHLVISDVMMPGLDGLQLVRALRGDPRTAGVPVLLLSARAGQEAAIEGLEAGADDYLVKPFSAQELLARVRANVKLARLRNHHATWRAALIDSLQEAFFVCDETGAVVEINTAFTDILGYGPEDLPYRPQHPWWPDEKADPEAHRQVSEAFTRVVAESKGAYTIPVTHRAGHRLWVAANFNEVRDPDTGRRLVVGTFRDVTTEHFAAQREAALAALSVRLAGAESLDAALRASVDELRQLWQARLVVAAAWNERGEVHRVAATPEADWEDLPQDVRAAVAALRGTIPLKPVSEAAGVGIALDHLGGPLALWIVPDPHRPLNGEDHAVLTILSGHLGQALQRIHSFDQQREVALTLQRAILGPPRLPPGFAVRYEPAARPLEVGGDWYDTVELADGRIGIVVGDCVGRGLAAATVMGQLRSACRALLLQSTGPAQTLAALDHFAALIPGALCTTVFCGILDPHTGELTYSSAGHPPGIVARPDGTTELLDGGRATPLAVRPGHPRPEATRTLPPSSVLLLYTDGLVERRRLSLDSGIAQAARAAGEGVDDPLDALADRLMAHLEPQSGYDDDVAVLLYRHPQPLEVVFAAESAELGPVRDRLRQWLARLDLAPRLAQDILIAAGEACANAIEHGHRDSPGGQVRLAASASAETLRLTVSDSGRWKEPTPGANPHRGHGLGLMRALMDEVALTTDETGTTVDMRTRSRR
ncbi:SpoIIE family protein phosphatase [Streptomyces sp. NPDC050856]|uniref:SpoIIE family protein phosphatase n=1 Tax=Streptomyces sp. NPDC050856 TaxID=3154939 RepID=UPI0034005523